MNAPAPSSGRLRCGHPVEEVLWRSRPCAMLGCRHHLAIEVTPSGGILYAVPDKELKELEETCSLDVADRGQHSLVDIGRMFGVTRELVRQLEERATRRLRNSRLGGVFEDVDGEGSELPWSIEVGLPEGESEAGRWRNR